MKLRHLPKNWAVWTDQSGQFLCLCIQNDDLPFGKFPKPIAFARDSRDPLRNLALLREPKSMVRIVISGPSKTGSFS